MLRSEVEFGLDRDVARVCGIVLTCVAEMARPRLPKRGSMNL